MEENDSFHLDLEFKRYLQILRPYLGHLTNENVITICNAWIQRLSDCTENEKLLRNKYVFSLCYQLAKGILEEPFMSFPPSENLLPFPESINSDDDNDSSTEVECVVVNADDHSTQFLFNHSTHGETSVTEFLSQGELNRRETESQCSDMKSSKKSSSRKHTILCYTSPEVMNNDTYDPGNANEFRAKSLIKKLRDIKNENLMLHTELMTLKEKSTSKHESNESIVKVNHATSAFLQSNESSATLKSLKFKLQEVQESRNSLINKIASLQEQLDNFNEMKQHEIEDLEAKYKLEIINIKTTVRDEMKDIYEKKIEELKTNHDLRIKEVENKSTSEIQDVKLSKDDLIEEKNKAIASKDLEISRLQSQIDDLKMHLRNVLEKLIDKPVDNTCGDTKIDRFRMQQLEKKLTKMEKNKIKSTRVYEAKLAQLQRDKHLAECSLQLQMVRQRSQIVNEVTDENQTELNTALDKLEVKYKEILANVQTTAIQRRAHDQTTLESILQTACGVPQSEKQFAKTMRNQNQSYDSEISPLLHCNKGNRSLGEDSLVAGYSFNGERMGELFERVYVPQRDNPKP